MPGPADGAHIQGVGNHTPRQVVHDGVPQSLAAEDGVRADTGDGTILLEGAMPMTWTPSTSCFREGAVPGLFASTSCTGLLQISYLLK